jgi:sec-independent protein translocase protein TatC
MATEPRLLTSDLFVALEYVRRSVLRLLIVFAVASAVAYPLAPQLLHFLARPLGAPLIMYAPLEGFMGYVTVAMTTSLCALAPLLLYEVHRLLRAVGSLPPRLALWGTVAAGGLFALGASFCYVVILPVTLRFFLNFGGENIEAGISVSRYLSLTLGLSAACGVTFELPLITLILHRLGLISVRFLTEHRRYAVLIGAIFTAIITPTPDAFTMSTLLLPLLALYEVSIVLMRIAERRQRPRVTHVAQRSESHERL